MKVGFKIESIIYYDDMFIEVINVKLDNTIINFGWKSIDNMLNIDDKERIGMWKIKNKKS